MWEVREAWQGWNVAAQTKKLLRETQISHVSWGLKSGKKELRRTEESDSSPVQLMQCLAATKQGNKNLLEK